MISLTKRGKALAKVITIISKSIGDNFFSLLKYKIVIKANIIDPMDEVWYQDNTYHIYFVRYPYLNLVST